ncbi:adenosylcobinamide-GDP ribazoletransferase [Rosistilla oblonga]|uniref:adenosylcobinamide-GDP ribazoletransferase n=1 Tax=Rosistilla oblonga TaxID=2527990 RepID=UPI003A981117
MSEPTQSSDRQACSLWECFVIAVQFLTRVSIFRQRQLSSDQYRLALRRSVLFFPIVGGFVGLFTAVTFATLLLAGVPALVSALVAVGFEALLTGAFHEDAFADTCDALGGGWTRDQVLEIMKDSRLGTYGTIALVAGVGARAAAIAAMGETDIRWSIVAIVAAAAIGRIAIVVMMATTSPIDDRASQARDVAGSQTLKTVIAATLASLPFWSAWLMLSPSCAAASMLVSAITLIWFRRKIMRRIGGTTGDLLGASGFLIQLVVTIGATAR